MKIMSLGMESCALAKRIDFLGNLLFSKHLVKYLALHRVLFSESAVHRIDVFIILLLVFVATLTSVICAAFDIFSLVKKFAFFYYYNIIVSMPTPG